MRLLNVNSGELELIRDGNIPAYAIISHTWGDEEVTFSSLKRLPQCKLQKLGECQKISSACLQALQDGLQYLWIDTLCIDKSSNAELSEAINSMFRWYHNAEKCYVYLSDVKASKYLEEQLPFESLESRFSRSRWFTRGWTLQELIAPQALEFFGHPWIYLGSRLHLQATITRITGIPREVCFDPDSVTRYSVAQRMSWAAARQTTLLEDTAYCLLGLLNVNMPLLYGEGTKAFTRLQEEIMKQSADFSLFAWENIEPPEARIGSVLAKSPSAFMRSAKIVSDPEIPEGLCVLHRGSLILRLPVLNLEAPREVDNWFHAIALLPCRLTDRPNQVLGLPLTKTDPDQPWKRFLGRHYGLTRISNNVAERARSQIIELDMSIASNGSFAANKHRECFEDLMTLLLHKGSCLDSTRDEWSTDLEYVMRRGREHLNLIQGAPERTRDALEISVLGNDHWKGLYIAGQNAESTNVQEQSVWDRAMLTSRMSASSERTTPALQLLLNSRKPKANEGAGRCGSERSTEISGLGSSSSLDQDDFAKDNAVFVHKASQGLSSDQTDAESCSSYLGFIDHWRIECTEAMKRIQRDHHEENDEKMEEEGDHEDKDESDDVMSLDSDIEFDDASSIASFTSRTDEQALLDVLVDTLVDMITEQSDLTSRLLDHCYHPRCGNIYD